MAKTGKSEATAKKIQSTSLVIWIIAELLEMLYPTPSKTKQVFVSKDKGRQLGRRPCCA